MTNRTLSLLVALAALPALPAAAPGASDRRPNIVLIFADDLGWNDFGYNGLRKPGFDGSGSRP